MKDRGKGYQLFSDGTYLVQIQRDGVRGIRRGTGGKSAAEQAREEVLAEISEEVRRREFEARARELGLDLPKRRGDSYKAITFGELFTQHYEPWARVELHPTTWNARKSTHWHLLNFFGDTPLDAIDKSMVDAFKKKRMDEGVVYRNDEGRQNRAPRALSKAGLAEQLKVLRAILRWAVKAEKLKAAPFVEMPRDKRGVPGAARPVRYFTVEERERLLRRAGSTNKNLPDVIRFGLLTGCRPAEIFHMRCRSVDIKRKMITVEEQPCIDCPDNKWIPKVGAWRQIEIAPELLPVVRRLLKDKKPGELLFDSEHGKPFTRLPAGGGGSFKRALAQSGLARLGLSFYSMRHTFGADLASAGVPLKKIAKLMGHSDARSTEVYAHLHPDSVDGVVANLRLPEEWHPLEIRQPEARASHLKALDGGRAAAKE